MANYGYSFCMSMTGAWLVWNGIRVSFFKGLNSGKWKFTVQDNVWRRTKTPIPKPSKINSYA